MKWGGSNKASFGEEGIRNISDQNHYMNISNPQTIKKLNLAGYIYCIIIFSYMYITIIANNSHFEWE